MPQAPSVDRTRKPLESSVTFSLSPSSRVASSGVSDAAFGFGPQLLKGDAVVPGFEGAQAKPDVGVRDRLKSDHGKRKPDDLPYAHLFHAVLRVDGRSLTCPEAILTEAQTQTQMDLFADD